MLAADLHHMEDDETCPASAYWRMVELTRTLERERDEWRGKAVAAAESWSATVADIGDDFRAKLVELRHAVRNLRDVQGRHHTQQATERLFALLPE